MRTSVIDISKEVWKEVVICIEARDQILKRFLGFVDLIIPWGCCCLMFDVGMGKDGIYIGKKLNA